jgi:hypothetical protein
MRIFLAEGDAHAAAVLQTAVSYKSFDYLAIKAGASFLAALSHIYTRSFSPAHISNKGTHNIIHIDRTRQRAEKCVLF